MPESGLALAGVLYSGPRGRPRAHHQPRWRNWQTHYLEVVAPQGMEVRILSWALPPGKRRGFCCATVATVHPRRLWRDRATASSHARRSGTSGRVALQEAREVLHVEDGRNGRVV